mmetsp:Transcript_26979/g.41371  ORF Transcript_26979/g.41371 Transcript_26979/m.41371 type:complete len:132 (+) Transcript_26979:297-692(+)
MEFLYVTKIALVHWLQGRDHRGKRTRKGISFTTFDAWFFYFWSTKRLRFIQVLLLASQYLLLAWMANHICTYFLRDAYSTSFSVSKSTNENHFGKPEKESNLVMVRAVELCLLSRSILSLLSSEANTFGKF